MIRSASKRIVRRYLRASIREEQRYQRMILAGRIDDLINSLKRKNPKLIDQIDYLVENDPTGRQKHLAWSVLQLKKREKPQEIIKSVKRFEDLLKRNRVPRDKKDLSKGKFPTLESLTTLISDLEGQKSESQRRREERSQVYAETDFIKLPKPLGDRYIVTIPKTTKASCYIGRGTKWCTSGKMNNMFEKYTIEGGVTLYYVIDKEREGGVGGDPFAKVAFAMYPPELSKKFEIFDARDKSLRLSDLPEDFEIIFKKYIRPHHSKLEKSPAREYKRLKTLTDLGLSASSSKAEIRDAMLSLKDNFTSSQINEILKLSLKELSLEADLSGVDLSRSDLFRVNLNNANLSGVDLSRSDLERARLRDANLSGANLRGSNLNGVDLRQSDLSGANLSGADIDRASLRGANLSGVNLDGANILGADLGGIDLSGVDFSKATLSEVNFSGSDLSGANLSGVDLSRTNFEEANLSGVDLSGADLSKANLSEANLSGVDLSGADLSKANFYRANLSGANFYEVNLSGVDLSGADLSGADLSEANLYGVNLSGANLSGADLSRADLSEVDLGGVILDGANLSRADLSGAIFFRTKYDDSTIWPRGFDPSTIR